MRSDGTLVAETTASATDTPACVTTFRTHDASAAEDPASVPSGSRGAPSVRVTFIFAAHGDAHAIESDTRQTPRAVFARYASCMANGDT